MITAFDIGALRCACGSAAIMCVDPGSEGERAALQATLFDLVLRRPVAARGWCASCFAAFAGLLPHEQERR
jgi:hypothetical protein